MDLSRSNKNGDRVYVWQYKNGAYHRLDMVGKAKGTTFKDTKTGGKYKVTAEGYKKKSGFKAKTPQVSYLAPLNKNKTNVTIIVTKIASSIKLVNLTDFGGNIFDIISIGALTHNVRSLDFSLKLD